MQYNDSLFIHVFITLFIAAGLKGGVFILILIKFYLTHLVFELSFTSLSTSEVQQMQNLKTRMAQWMTYYWLLGAPK